MTPRCEKPEVCGISATASEAGVLRARSLLDLSESGSVLKSIDAGVSRIGSKGLSMAALAAKENPYKQPLEANNVGDTADNLYFRVMQPTRVSFFLEPRNST